MAGPPPAPFGNNTGPGERRCTGCREIKPLSAFRWSKRSGRSARCRPCVNAAERDRRRRRLRNSA